MEYEVSSKLRLFFGLSSLMIATFSTAQNTQEDMELIRGVFDAYFDDFVSRDFEGMASHYQAPLMIIPTRTINSREGIVDFFRQMPIRKDMHTALKTRLLSVE
jgi:DeoR/GlpR family transcriptional regulator of sugar metabolism